MRRWGFSGGARECWHILKPDDPTQANHETYCSAFLDKSRTDVLTQQSRPKSATHGICWTCERIEREERRANAVEPPRQETLFQDENTES